MLKNVISLLFFLSISLQPLPQTSRFIDKIDESLICSICSGVFRSPHALDCGHTFCKFCIDGVLKKKKECPLCKKSVQEGSIFPNLILKSVLEDLFIRCHNHKVMGCDAVVTLERLEKHEKNCPKLEFAELAEEYENLQRKIYELSTLPNAPSKGRQQKGRKLKV